MAKRPDTEEEVREILNALIDANYSVGKIEVKPTKRKPAAPLPLLPCSRRLLGGWAIP